MLAPLPVKVVLCPAHKVGDAALLVIVGGVMIVAVTGVRGPVHPDIVQET